jgi:hypothetical protein
VAVSAGFFLVLTFFPEDGRDMILSDVWLSPNNTEDSSFIVTSVKTETPPDNFQVEASKSVLVPWGAVGYVGH